MNEFCFINDKHAYEGIADALKTMLCGQIPIVVCVGTDATIGDSLGPLVGTLLKNMNTDCFIYGTLEKPLTAKDIVYTKKFIEGAHPLAKILIIDAAVGKDTDVGVIKINNAGLKPGLGANKNLPLIGDVGIIGIVAPRSKYNYALLNLTRLGQIFSFSESIAKGINLYIEQNISERNQTEKQSNAYQFFIDDLKSCDASKQNQII